MVVVVVKICCYNSVPPILGVEVGSWHEDRVLAVRTLVVQKSVLFVFAGFRLSALVNEVAEIVAVLISNRHRNTRDNGMVNEMTRPLGPALLGDEDTGEEEVPRAQVPAHKQRGERT